MDPHCGWCYANGSNIEYVYNALLDDLELEIIPGGMWLNEHAPTGGEQLKTFIGQHAPGLVEKTGAELSDDYYALVENPDYTFSSFEPSAAIVAVNTIAPNKTLAFAKGVQDAIYKHGQRLDELEAYMPALTLLGIDLALFKETWLSAANKAATFASFEEASGLASGYPTLLLVHEDKYYRVASGYFNGQAIVEGIKTFMFEPA